MKFSLQAFLHLLKDKADFSAAVHECGARSTQLLSPSSLTWLHLSFLVGFPSVCRTSVLLDNNMILIAAGKGLPLHLSPELY